MSGEAHPDPLPRLRDYVDAMQASDHGWAAVAGRGSDAESTAWVLVGASMLKVLGHHRDRALEWLLRRQRSDGSWEYRPGLAIATWPTAPALIGLTMAGAGVEARARATTWLVKERSAMPNFWQRAFREIASRREPDNEPLVVLDETLDGFGWARQTFAWVEPTAIAMCALALQPRSPAMTERVATGVRLLLDRQSRDGGWNYGNRRVLKVDLPGYPDTTGWALLGLAAARRAGIGASLIGDAAAARGLDAQDGPEASMPSPLTMALRFLARRAHGGTGSIADRSASLALMRAALLRALDGVRDGYPTLDTRTAILALLALHDADLLAAVSP